MNIKEDDALHCPEDRGTRKWGGGWERRIKQGFTEDCKDGLSEVLRDELNSSGEQGKKKHWK